MNLHVTKTPARSAPTHSRQENQHDISLANITVLYSTIQEHKLQSVPDTYSPSSNITFDDTATAPLKVGTSIIPLLIHHAKFKHPAILVIFLQLTSSESCLLQWDVILEYMSASFIKSTQTILCAHNITLVEVPMVTSPELTHALFLTWTPQS